jgi:hypothetical protein
MSAGSGAGLALRGGLNLAPFSFIGADHVGASRSIGDMVRLHAIATRGRVPR